MREGNKVSSGVVEYLINSNKILVFLAFVLIVESITAIIVSIMSVFFHGRIGHDFPIAGAIGLGSNFWFTARLKKGLAASHLPVAEFAADAESALRRDCAGYSPITEGRRDSHPGDDGERLRRGQAPLLRGRHE